MKLPEGGSEMPSSEEKELAKKEGAMNMEKMPATILYLVDPYEDPKEILLPGPEGHHIAIQTASEKEAARILLEGIRKALLLNWRAGYGRWWGSTEVPISPSEKMENEAAELLFSLFCAKVPEKKEITTLLDELEQVTEGKCQLSSVSVMGRHFGLLTEEDAKESSMEEDL